MFSRQGGGIGRLNQSLYISHCSISVVNLNYKTLISMRGMSIHAEGGCSRSL